MQIFEAAGDKSLSLKDVYSSMHLRGTPKSIGTLTKVVRSLEIAGLLKRLERKGGCSDYCLAPIKINFQKCILICSSCSRAQDVLNDTLHDLLESIYKSHDFVLDEGLLKIELLCRTCV